MALKRMDRREEIKCKVCKLRENKYIMNAHINSTCKQVMHSTVHHINTVLKDHSNINSISHGDKKTKKFKKSYKS